MLSLQGYKRNFGRPQKNREKKKENGESNGIRSYRLWGRGFENKKIKWVSAKTNSAPPIIIFINRPILLQKSYNCQFPLLLPLLQVINYFLILILLPLSSYCIQIHHPLLNNQFPVSYLPLCFLDS